MSHHFHIPKLCVLHQGRNISTKITKPLPQHKLTVTKVPIVKPKSVAINICPTQRHERKNVPVVKPRNKLITQAQRKTGVKYITQEPSKQSLNKIAEIKNSGAGRILAIIGNGPSINEIPLHLLNQISSLDVISINQPDMRIWPTKYWAFFDRSQQKRHESVCSSYDGVLFNSTSINIAGANSVQFKYLPGSGFSTNMAEGLYIGRSSVYACMQIALWMGYDHIYIFGCDMNAQGIDGKLHFYGHNPDVKPELRAQRFSKEAESYNYAAENLDEHIRSRFTFCSEYNPFEFVHKFCSLSHKLAIQHIIDKHGT
jgi:hypothetical protein